MNRQQLAHILRSSCRIVGDKDVLVIGSQSILGSYDEDDLPVEATASIEADIAFLDDLAVSKLAAGREKDKAYVDALLEHGLLDVQKLRERNELLPDDHQGNRDRTRVFLEVCGGSSTWAASAAASRPSPTGPPEPDDPHGRMVL